MAIPSLYDDEPFGGDQWLEDQEYEAYGATAEGLEDDPHLMHDEEAAAFSRVATRPVRPLYLDNDDVEIPF